MDIKATEIGYELPPVVKNITAEKIFNYSARYGGIFLRTLHTDKGIAKKAGFPDVLLQGSQALNYANEMLFKAYREHWINNSNIKVSYIKSVFPGDTLIIRGKVKEKKSGKSNMKIKLDIWAEDKSGDKTMIGEAEVRF